MLGRSSLFKRALAACGKLRARHPDNVAIKSVISQLHYLKELDAGRSKDGSRLDTIVIGVLARREIAFLDVKTAKLLEKVADEARKMEAATRQASPKPAAASPARSARPAALPAPPKAAPLLAGDLARVGPLSGAGDLTTGPGGRGEGAITGGPEVLARVKARGDGDVTSDSFALDAAARFVGRSVVEAGGRPARRIASLGLTSGKPRPERTTTHAGHKDGRENLLKSAYLQCRLYCRTGLVLLLRMEGYDDIQARAIIDNHPSRGFRITDDDLAFEERRAQRLAERKAHKPLKPA